MMKPRGATHCARLPTATVAAASAGLSNGTAAAPPPPFSFTSGPLALPASGAFTMNSSISSSVSLRGSSSSPSSHGRRPSPSYSDATAANRDLGVSGGEMRSRGRYATPADFLLHGDTPYRGLRVRRWGLGCVHRSRATFCRAVAKP
jgi:hypothetical protein